MGSYLLPVVLALAATEILLRLVAPHIERFRPLLYQPSVHTAYDRIDTLEELMETTVLGFRPGTERAGFVLNSRSMRTPEYGDAADPGILRIIALGDSFTHASGGTPYSGMWPARLESRLESSLGRPVDVFSLAVPGTGPAFQLRLWELEHRLVRPAAVIVAFFVGNDFTDGQEHNVWPASQWEPARISLGVRLFRNAWRLHRAVRRTPAEDDRPPAEALPSQLWGTELELQPDLSRFRTRTPAEYIEMQARQLWLCVERNAAERRRLADTAAEVLRRMRDQVEASGARFLVLVIPAEFQVDSALLDAAAVHAGVAAVDIDLDAPQADLALRLAAAGIDFVDSLPEVRESVRVERLYWLRNSHWNERGHELAAGLLASYLLGREWFARSPDATESPLSEPPSTSRPRTSNS